jgi:hypothetical protein
MNEARLGADDLGQMGREGEDVVLGLAFDLVDTGDVEGDVTRLGPDGFGGFLRDHAEFRLGVAACASISNQILKRVCGSQMEAISGRV